MQAIILAGGKGLRLGNLTSEIPKPMISIGNNPILEHQIELFKRYGIVHIFIIVNHLHEKIYEHFNNGQKWGVSIDYYLEQEPLGTSGAIPFLRKKLGDQFFVLYGDVMLDMDLSRLMLFHTQKKAEATLVVHPNDHPHDSDLVEINENSRVLKFHSKPRKENTHYKNLVNAGLYLFNKSMIEQIPIGIKKDFGKDIFPTIVKDHLLYAYNTPEYLKDMGTPDRLKKVRQDYMSGKIQKKNLSNRQKAIFLDRDGVLNEDRNLIYKEEDFILYEFTSDTIKKINQSDYLSIVVTNQSVIARNLCTIEALENIHKKLDTDLGKKNAKLDALYYCPYHPDKGYPEEIPKYKREHPWRKPNPGMLLQAAMDFNIDLTESYIIGDRSSDIETGINANVITIGVRTGDALKFGNAVPDFMFDNLKSAVDFILDDPLNDTFQEVIQAVESTNEKPFIIALAGQSLSGKSTLTNYLSKRFKKEGYSSGVIRLDDWLLPDHTSNETENVLQRFDIDRIQKDLIAFFNGKPVITTSYTKTSNETSKGMRYVMDNEDIIIIEGTISLNVKYIVENANLTYFLHLDLEEYKEQFYKLYRSKGYREPSIKELLSKRLNDEFEPIEKTMPLASKVISII